VTLSTGSTTSLASTPSATAALRVDAERDRGVEHARAVEVNRHVVFAGDLRRGRDPVDRDRLPAPVVVRVLHGEEAGPGAVEVLVDEALADRFGGRHAALAGVYRPRLDARELRRARQFPAVDVRLVLQEQLLTRLRADVDCDLVRHRPGGDVQRGLGPDRLGGAGLQLVDGRVVAVHVVADLGGRGRVAPHRVRGGRHGVRAQVDVEFVGFGHRLWVVPRRRGYIPRSRRPLRAANGVPRSVPS